MTPSLARVGLMAGNFVVGVTILAPAGMLTELAQSLGVSLREAGLLVTYGAIVLCLGSPLMAWLTARIERKTLLTATLAAMVAGNLASALAPDYGSLVIIRMLTLVFAALYTPQAASTVALIVPERERASAIAFVFLGWALAFAVGLPLVTMLAEPLGWRGVHGVLVVAALLCTALLMRALPRRLHGKPLSLSSFGTIARDRHILLILLVTFLSTAGQLAIFIYMAPLLGALAGGGREVAGSFFALFGGASLVGNIAASRIVQPLGPRRTLAICLGLVIAGIALWAFAAGSLAAMALGLALWGLGFAATNSMQQARLNAAVPALASVSIALNTSLAYVGQAVGTALGGWLLAHDRPEVVGYAALALAVSSAIVLALERYGRRPDAASRCTAQV
ncbi:MFS transporter [Chelatococcus reniformis]|nr:MFS transporter [Chelatococcus reniformis]